MTTLVIGAGASGAAAAWRLATGGESVICLEQGDWVDPDASPATGMDWELALQRRFHPDPNQRRLPGDYPVVHADTPIRPALYNAVGGSTIRWGAHFPRFHPSDFRVRSLDGVAADWPLDYAELEPWYDLNDRMMGVAGLAGDPANPPRSRRAMPPLPLGPGGTRLAEACNRLGWHWWPSDAAINSAPYDGRGACNNCGPCGLGCVRRARASTDLTYWPKAIAAGAELVTGARVSGIETEGRRAVAVHCVDRAGDRHRLAADRVVMAANGMGTPRLLLHAGIADASGLLGRGLMHHPTAIVTGVFAERLDGHRGAFACALYSQQFYETDPARGFVRGYQLQGLRGQGPLGTALGGYMARIPWGSGHHGAFSRQFAHTMTVTVTAEDLPDPDNRVTLDPRLTDSDGVPAPRLAYRLDANCRALLDHGIARATELLQAAGAIEVVVNPLAEAAGFHFLGTARMGDDPSRSVTDRWGRLHGYDNLYAIDGSLFVTSAAVNPTPTIQALALRTADHLLEQQR